MLILLILAFVFFFFEIFVPGGILAILGGICLIWASWYNWIDYGPLVGLTTFLFGCITAGLLFFIEIRVISRSRWGRQFKLESAVNSTATQAEDTIPPGTTGVALTSLVPTGTVSILGKTCTARSIDGFVASGTAVQVTGSDNFQLIVKKQ